MTITFALPVAVAFTAVAVVTGVTLYTHNKSQRAQYEHLTLESPAES